MADLTYDQLLAEVRRGFGATFADRLQAHVDAMVEDAQYEGYENGRDAGYYNADDRYSEGYDDGYDAAREEFLDD